MNENTETSTGIENGQCTPPPRRVSRSAYDYLRLKGLREDGYVVPGMFMNRDFRYGMHTTTTTRRASHHHDAEKTY